MPGVQPSPKTRAAILVLRASVEAGVADSFRVHILAMLDVARGEVAELTVADPEDAVKEVSRCLAAFTYHEQ
jgi:hypothetical protein